MMIDGYYYLHTNGELIYKNYLDDGQVADFRESDFVRMFWPIDLRQRGGAWTILVEASALGANPARVHELAEKWACHDQDGKQYAKWLEVDVTKDGNMWCAHKKDFINLQESPAGFGLTILEAMTDLCKNLGYTGSKLWGVSFPDLCKAALSTEEG